MHLKYKTNYLSARNARTVYNIFPIFLYGRYIQCKIKYGSKTGYLSHFIVAILHMKFGNIEVFINLSDNTAAIYLWKN